jgi:hypothetical protein
VYCRPIWSLAGLASARVVARFMDVDLVGVPAFALVFAFGSRSHLGWRPRLDGRLRLCLCSRSGVVRGHIGGRRGYGVQGCGHNVGGGVAGMGNQRTMVVMKKEG